jgi:hypothetical protein
MKNEKKREKRDEKTGPKTQSRPRVEGAVALHAADSAFLPRFCLGKEGELFRSCFLFLGGNASMDRNQ